MAFAEYLKDKTNYEDLGFFYQRKRDYFVDLIKTSRFKIIPSHGTYFQLLDFSAITDEPEIDFAQRMTREYKLASIPVSVFYQKNMDNKVLRFCFCQKRRNT
ncbi:MAG: aminotransferase class I/II-fold pyridoxal phosphate-dependent enzyme [Bacteroidales bacterium]